MRSIIRRIVTRDPGGRVICVTAQHLTDDGQGRVRMVNQRTAMWCSGCGRPVVDTAELRGRCDHCHRKGCCVQCDTQCQGCGRRLCGGCRRSFMGTNLLTVCPVCQIKLARRQAVLDRLAWEKEVFQRRLLLLRERVRISDQRTRQRRGEEAARLAAQRERNRLILGAARSHGRRLQ